jgi:hypothetical protein
VHLEQLRVQHVFSSKDLQSFWLIWD